MMKAARLSFSTIIEEGAKHMFVGNDLAKGIAPETRNNNGGGTAEPKTDPEKIHSTGEGYGHLADAHAIRSSPVPELHHRYPKTIS